MARKPLPENITHIGQLKNSEFLASYDLNGKTVKVTIDEVFYEEVHNPKTSKKEWKTVISMKGAEKRLVLNVTKSKAIASWHGVNPKQWSGKAIELKAGTTKMAGVDVDCINVIPNDKAKVKNSSDAAVSAAQ